jgi:hypothetical protein
MAAAARRRLRMEWQKVETREAAVGCMAILTLGITCGGANVDEFRPNVTDLPQRREGTARKRRKEIESHLGCRAQLMAYLLNIPHISA